VLPVEDLRPLADVDLERVPREVDELLERTDARWFRALEPFRADERELPWLREPERLLPDDVKRPFSSRS
jgi:hypothetical protein